MPGIGAVGELQPEPKGFDRGRLGKIWGKGLEVVEQTLGFLACGHAEGKEIESEEVVLEVVAGYVRAKALAEGDQGALGLFVVTHASLSSRLQPFELQELVRLSHERKQRVAQGESREGFLRACEIRAIRETVSSRQSCSGTEPGPGSWIRRAEALEKSDGIGRLIHLRVEKDEQLRCCDRFRGMAEIAVKALRAEQEPNCLVAATLVPAEDRKGAEVNPGVGFVGDQEGGRVERCSRLVKLSPEAMGIADEARGADGDRVVPFMQR